MCHSGLCLCGSGQCLMLAIDLTERGADLSLKLCRVVKLSLLCDNDSFRCVIYDFFLCVLLIGECLQLYMRIISVFLFYFI